MRWLNAPPQGARAPAPGFSPLDLNPNVLLDPDTFGLTDGQSVATANDTSGNGRNFTQGTAGNQPTLRGGASLLNGHIVVEHDGFDDYLSGPDLSALTSGHAFGVVKVDADPPAAAGVTGLWRLTSATGINTATHFPWTDGSIYDGSMSTTRKVPGNPAAALTSWRIYEVRSASGDWEAKLDGTSLLSTATNTVGFASLPRLGSSFDGSDNYWLDGRWAYFALFPALNTADANSMRSWLQTRFAL